MKEAWRPLKRCIMASAASNTHLRWTALLCVPWLAMSAPASAESAARRELNQVMASRPVEVHGADLFRQCAGCHGSDGGGTADGSVPRIAGQHFSVLARQIVDFRYGERWDARMEGVASNHSVLAGAQDIADVASFVSRLESDGKRGIRDGQYVESGATIYGERCSSCHGVDGSGNDQKQVPRIAGQHAGYLSRQIYDAVDGRRPVLAKSHGKRFAPLGFEDVLGLTDYLARIGWQHPPDSPAN
jgi:cytochrome c553